MADDCCPSCGARVSRSQLDAGDPCPACGSTPPGAAFACPVQREGDVARIAPRGELDVATVPLLEREVIRARAAGARRIVCDLRGLTFADSTAVSRLILLTRAAAEAGVELCVLAGEGPVARVLDVMQVRDLLQLIDPEEGRA